MNTIGFHPQTQKYHVKLVKLSHGTILERFTLNGQSKGFHSRKQNQYNTRVTAYLGCLFIALHSPANKRNLRVLLEKQLVENNLHRKHKS